MTRTDRSWTAVVAECGLDRAQPLLAALVPDPFQRVNLARALDVTALVLDRGTPFVGLLRPKLEDALGPDAAVVFAALTRLPLYAIASPATAFWRGLFRDLHGRSQPSLSATGVANWAAFSDAFRGRAGPDDVAPHWLNQVAADAQVLRNLSSLAKTQRARPLTPHDRSLYARFGWNDDGDIPGMTGLLNAAALLRTQRAWAVAASLFDAEAQEKIMVAAGHIVTAERSAALETLEDDAKRYGVTRSQLAANLYPVRVVPPLTDILKEAALC